MEHDKFIEFRDKLAQMALDNNARPNCRIFLAISKATSVNVLFKYKSYIRWIVNHKDFTKDWLHSYIDSDELAKYHIITGERELEAPRGYFSDMFLVLFDARPRCKLSKNQTAKIILSHDSHLKLETYDSSTAIVMALDNSWVEAGTFDNSNLLSTFFNLSKLDLFTGNHSYAEVDNVYDTVEEIQKIKNFSVKAIDHSSVSFPQLRLLKSIIVHDFARVYDYAHRVVVNGDVENFTSYNTKSFKERNEES